MMVTGALAHSSLPLFSSSKTSLPTLEENVPAYTRRLEAKVQRPSRCQISSQDSWNNREFQTDRYEDVFKRGKIKQWAMDVDRNMLHNSRPSTTKTPRSASSRGLSLGPPDEEDPGFRRIKIPKDVSESNYKPKTVSSKNLKVTWKNTNPASPREKCHSGFKRNGQDYTRHEESLHTASNYPPRPSSNGQVQKQTLNPVQNDNEKYISSSSPELYIRSSSNRLLNVISIDDYMLRHKHQSWGSDTSSNPVSIEDIMNRSRTNSAYLSTKDKQSGHGSAQWRINQQSQHQGNGQYLTVPNDAFTSNIPKSASIYGRLQSQSHHSAAHRAIDSIIGTREVVHSRACKGLYKYEASCQDSFENPPESKRFQKLNRKLHKMIDREFFGPNRKINQRRPPSTRSVPSYNSKPGENVMLSARKYVSSPRVSEKKEKDNLFEMLMELDDKSNGTDVIKMRTDNNEATIKKM